MLKRSDPILLIARSNETFKLSIKMHDLLDQPTDLSNATVRMQIRDTPKGTVYYDSKNGADFSITALEGKILLMIPTSTVGSWSFSKGVYDIVVSMPNEDDVILYGPFELVQGVTE